MEPPLIVMPAQRCAVVTGANKGIGFHCVEQLHAELDETYDVVLTSRSAERGQAAAEELRSAAPAGSERIVYRQCDIASEESVDAFRSWIAAEYGGVDLLINNAGFAYQVGRSYQLHCEILTLELSGGAINVLHTALNSICSCRCRR